MPLVYPPNEVFFSPRLTLGESMGGYSTNNWIRTVCPPEGGMFAYYSDHAYPRKGHTYPEACEANNTVKKTTMSLLLGLNRKEMLLPGIGFMLLPWKRKINFLENFLSHYLWMCDYTCRAHFYKKRFYTLAGQELWEFTRHFLQNLGFSADIANRSGRMVAHLMEHDDAYFLRVKDIFTEMSKGAMMANPRWEIKRVLGVYFKREHAGIEFKFNSVASILSYAMLVPKVRKAFTSAFREVKIENLRLDEADEYFASERSDYDFMGKDNEQRHKDFINSYNRHSILRFKELVKVAVTDPVAYEGLKQQLVNMGV